MGLLQPESGLLFWMVISFGVVFVLLAKFGFPVITRMVEERRVYVEKSLEAAKQANEQLAGIKSESEALLQKAREEQMRILNEAAAAKQARIMAAEAEAASIMKVQQALADAMRMLNENAPNDQVIKLKALEAFQKVADGKATKIIIPSEIQGLAGLAASAKTLLEDDKPEQNQ